MLSNMPDRSSEKPEKKDRKSQEAASDILDAVIPNSETGDDSPPEPPKKNPAAVALGRLGGKKGGPARAKKLTKERRSEIAKKAAESRWKKKDME